MTKSNQLDQLDRLELLARKSVLEAEIDWMYETLTGCDWCCGGDDEEEAIREEISAIDSQLNALEGESDQ